MKTRDFSAKLVNPGIMLNSQDQEKTYRAESTGCWGAHHGPGPVRCRGWRRPGWSGEEKELLGLDEARGGSTRALGQSSSMLQSRRRLPRSNRRRRRWGLVAGPAGAGLGAREGSGRRWLAARAGGEADEQLRAGSYRQKRCRD